MINPLYIDNSTVSSSILYLSVMRNVLHSTL